MDPREKRIPIYSFILFQKKTLCKGKLMISLNFREDFEKESKIGCSDNTPLTTGWNAPKPSDFFGEGFSEGHLAPDESLRRTRKNDPVVLELASNFRASG